MYFYSVIFAKLSLTTEFSLWFIPLCLLIGFVYAYLLYNTKNPWSKQINYCLAATRFIVGSLISFLLLGPLLNQITYQEEAPILVLNIDDSESITKEDSIWTYAAINEISSALSSENIDIVIKGLEDYTADTELSFKEPKTNLSRTLEAISQDYEQQNLIGAILISDGIHNYGASPQFQTLSFPVNTVGLGDTIPAKDLSIKKVNYNKVVFQGKQFPISIDVFNNGFVNENIFINLYSENTRVGQKIITPKGDQQINSVEFLLDADVVGIKSYRISIAPKDGESTTANNVQRTFIEIIESQQKILFAAKAPHPDIKALRTIIESKEGTEVSVWIEGFDKGLPEGPFDLVIYHQLPGFNDLPEEIDHWIDDSNSFFITGTAALDNINRRNPVLSYKNLGQTDQVVGNLSTQFDLFEIDNALIGRMNEYPPLTVPYGNFELKEGAQIMCYQKIGNVQTNRPLITVWNNGDQKSAVISGAGIWKWQLQESAIYENANLFNELFGKLIQYLSTTENKSNFEVGPTKESFTDSELIEFNTEVYNELYEKVYDYNISMKVKDEENNTVEYNYVNNPNSTFSISNLEAGVYQFEASVQVNNKTEISQGSFSVEALQLENIDLTANHQLLRNISNNSGGQFYQKDQTQFLIDDIISQNPKPISRSSEQLNPLIDQPLWLILLISLLAFEWFMRKYYGSY